MKYAIPPDHVIHDILFAQSATPPFMWHRPKTLLNLLEKLNITGKGLKIGIVDTGYTPHPWLPEPKGAKNFTDSRTVEARNPHGEHVFGIIGGLHGIGLLPEAEFYIAKGLNDRGEGDTTWLNNGIRWCADNGCHFLNGSYGGGSGSQDDKDAANYFYSKGGLNLHFAAGNANYNGRNNSIGYPAKWDMCSVNGSYNADGTRSSFSSGGEQLDIMGAGGAVVSTMPPSANNPTNMGAMSGTSMGSPDVTAHAGCLHLRRRQVGLPDIVGYKAWNTYHAELFERKRIKDGGSPGRDNYFGWGQFMTEAIMEEIKDPIGA